MPNTQHPTFPEPDMHRFPALSKLSPRGHRRIPFVQQLEAAECGAACLAMVLGYHGQHVRVDTVREVAGVGLAGLDALSILKTGEHFGMCGRGIRLDFDDLAYLPPASILHWKFNHFIVFEGMARRGVKIIDPVQGRRLVSFDEFRRSFTGIALLLERTESFTPSARDSSSVWHYLKQLVKRYQLVSRTLVISLLLRLFAMSLPVFTALVVDRVVPQGDTRLLAAVAIALFGIVAFQWVSNLVRSHLLLQLRTNLDTQMTLGFLDHLLSLPYRFFQLRSTGDLILRVNSNVTIREILTSNTLASLLDGVLVLIYLAVIFALSPIMATTVLGLGLLHVLVFVLSKRQYRELMSQDLEAQSKSQAYLVQMLAGIETLKLSGTEHRAIEHWSNLFVNELNASLKRGRLSALIDSLKQLLQTSSPLLLLGYGAMIVMRGEMSLGTMLAINALSIGFLMPLSVLVESALQLQLLRSYTERLDDVMLCEPEQDRQRVNAAPRFKGHIELNHVSFRYNSNSPMAVEDLSLTIEAGSCVAIVGSSGSGKSTLIALLLGLYQPSQGSIYYDGHRLSELDLRTVRRQIGVVPQRPYLFSGSLYDNIALANPQAPRECIVAAARAACIHDDIEAMPMSYESLIADGGSSLSGGQNQRIVLARALTHQPAILILDEATSALDSKTESTVMANLQALHCTRIIIAHRLSTVANADQIIVMDKGRIMETGTHEQLLARGRIYRDLVAAQARLSKEMAA